MKRILIQCKRELLLFIRDHMTVFMAFVLPCISLILVGFAIRLEAKEMPLVVQNFDIGSASRELVDRIFANNQVIRAKWSGGDPSKRALDAGTARMAITIPPDFSRRLDSGEPATFSVLIDGTDVNNARVLKNGLLGTLQALQKIYDPQHSDIVVPDIRIWFNPGRKEALYIVPGAFGYMLWIYPGLLATLSTSRERELGTILQIYSSSITAFEFLAGKFLAFTVVGCAQAAILYLVCLTVFHAGVVADWSSFLAGSVAFLLSSVGFGIMAGTFARTQVVAVQICGTTGATFSLLFSGYVVPLKEVVFPFSLISYVVPLKYYIILARDAFVRGAGFGHTFQYVLILCVFVAVFFGAAWWHIHDMNLEH